jgi:nucleotide-binding universal stress UspA family protein
MAITRKGQPDHAHESVLERELFVAGRVAKKPEPLRGVLVGVSGSKQSERAARLAARIAGPGAKVLLAFVREPSADGAKEAENLRAENFLDDVWRSLGLEESHVRTVVREGEPADVLAELAQGDGVDLVVVGSRGGNALVRTLGGGVAERFIGKSDKPLLIVR